jgi:hypothetical protein
MADHRTVFSYGPVQQLYEAAKLVLEDNNRPRGETLKRLQVAVNGLEAAAQRSDRLAHVRKAAADLYVGQDGDIDIDDACLAHLAVSVQTHPVPTSTPAPRRTARHNAAGRPAPHAKEPANEKAIQPRKSTRTNAVHLV